jgi:hypothetical protein
MSPYREPHPKNYDTFLKGKLWNPDHYDRVIRLVCQYNPCCEDEE